MTRRDGPAGFHGPKLTAREALLFEAGIKLGGVFHQYVGIPVSPRTAGGLARAIEDAVGLQPFVESVTVRVDPRRGAPVGKGVFAYRYLTAEMLTVTVRIRHGRTTVTARLDFRQDLRYPLMHVVRATGPSPSAAPNRSRTGRR
jgi:hypothetical protein